MPFLREAWRDAADYFRADPYFVWVAFWFSLTGTFAALAWGVR